MHVTFRQLRVFEAVARRQSYTRAAEELHLTQPAVSMQTKQLENAVGSPLFEVLGKKVYLTEAGETLLKHTHLIIEQINAAERDIEHLRGVDSGKLKITIASTVNYFAARLLSRFCEQFPKVSVNLDVTNRETLLKKLEANEPDLVLMGKPPRDIDLIAEAFMQNPLIVIAAPGHPLATLKTVPLKRLAGESLILREPGSGTRIAIERFFKEKNIEPISRSEMTSNEAIKQAVEAGLGLAIVSRHTVDLELSVGRLVQLKMQSFPIRRHWYVAHRKGKRLSKTAQAFKDFVIKEGQSDKTVTTS